MSQEVSVSAKMDDSSREYDFVVFGATSFVGQILTAYLLEHLDEHHESLRWAIAGRSEEKLSRLKASLGALARHVPIILADASNYEQMQGLCRQTRTVVSTVGPFALYGESLVKACAQNGTDYCDSTGEFHWVRRMIDRYQAQAMDSGARLIPCCGFDSVPSDLGVSFLQQQAMQFWGTAAQEVKMRVKVLQGGGSGGTYASVINLIKEAIADPSVRKQLSDPYSLCPSGRATIQQHEVKLAEYDRDFSSWVAPFAMAMINERVVHRSNALFGYLFGKHFQYNEGVLTGPGIGGRTQALITAVGIHLFGFAAAVAPLRFLMEKFLLPKPGEGPGPEARRKGSFDIRFFGRTDNGQTLQVKVTGDRDPGYGATARMLGQAVICLAKDQRDQPEKPSPKGGFGTPSTMLGDRYLERLILHAGLRFEVLS